MLHPDLKPYPKYSAADLEPGGSVLKWLHWIRIRIPNTDPDPGQSERRPRRAIIQIFQAENTIDL